MAATWKDVRCACIRRQDLLVLAELRGRADFRVELAGERAWVWWDGKSALHEEAVVRRILPLPGAALFAQRGGRWHRLGAHLPAFDVPAHDRAAALPLEQVIVPTAIDGEPPEPVSAERVRIGLLRDGRGLSRPATALRCSLATLETWADRATAAQLGSLWAAWTRGPHAEEAATSPEVLVRGAPGKLPALPYGVRYWGALLLVPLGFRAVPDLPEPALLGALGGGDGELAVLDEDGFELMPRAAFEPLSRAGIRLARAATEASFARRTGK
jgi:hypothetical protein